MKIQIVKLHAAAFIFSQNPNIPVPELAAELGVSEGAIYRWARRPEWDNALDELKFIGERAFYREPRRDLKRESGKAVERAFILIDQLTADGHLTEKQAVTRTAELLFPDEDKAKARRRVYEWNRKRRKEQ